MLAFLPAVRVFLPTSKIHILFYNFWALDGTQKCLSYVEVENSPCFVFFLIYFNGCFTFKITNSG